MLLPVAEIVRCRHEECAHLAVEGGIGRDEAAVGRLDHPGVLAAAWPLPGLPAVVVGEQHGLGVDRERQPVVAHRQTDPGGAAEAAERVLPPEEHVDASLMDDGSRVEGIFRGPGHIDTGDGAGEVDVGQVGQDLLADRRERSDAPGVGHTAASLARTSALARTERSRSRIPKETSKPWSHS